MIVKMYSFTDEGEITHYYEGSVEFAQNVHTRIVETFPDPKTEYWNGTALTPRPLHNVTINKTSCNADGFDIVTLQNVSGKLFIDSVEYPVPDTTIDITFDEPGQHFIRVKNFPMQDFEATIYAN